jgi:hypothetical protein
MQLTDIDGVGWDRQLPNLLQQLADQDLAGPDGQEAEEQRRTGVVHVARSRPRCHQTYWMVLAKISRPC